MTRTSWLGFVAPGRNDPCCGVASLAEYPGCSGATDRATSVMAGTHCPAAKRTEEGTNRLSARYMAGTGHTRCDRR